MIVNLPVYFIKGRNYAANGYHTLEIISSIIERKMRNPCQNSVCFTEKQESCTYTVPYKFNFWKLTGECYNFNTLLVGSKDPLNEPLTLSIKNLSAAGFGGG